MDEFIDVIELFTEMANKLKKGIVSLHSPLEELVLKASGGKLAYIDNRRDAKEKCGQDFWSDVDKAWLKSPGIEERLLYSKSEQFPDFLLKVRRQEDKLTRGSLLELKDSKGGSIASFNSTLPTKYKSLEEIDVINGTNLVSRVALAKDGELAQVENYHTYQRRSFYLIRTHRDDERVKLSIVDGSFFETVPKEHLIYQMFLNVLRSHLEKKEIKISPEAIKRVEELLSCVTDQTIIAASQIIEGASVRPRLRIMAEVHSEGNPHNASFYPEISEQSLNFILQVSPAEREQLGKVITSQIPEVKIFTMYHKRNGEHMVFQLNL
jgi:hypothetical protein